MTSSSDPARIQPFIFAFEQFTAIQQAIGNVRQSDFPDWEPLIAMCEQAQLCFARFQTRFAPEELREATQKLLERRFAADPSVPSMPNPPNWPVSTCGTSALIERIDRLSLGTSTEPRLPELSRASTDYVADQNSVSSRADW